MNQSLALIQRPQPRCVCLPGLDLLAVLAYLLTSSCTLSAENAGLSEYQVKAAIVFNLTKYVDWPPATFAGNDSPLVLGILGQDNFGDDFKRMVEDKTINGRKLLLRRVNWNDDLKSIHLLFISASETKRLPEIFERVANRPVLTVGEMDAFLAAGGMINLAKKNNRIRPSVNLAAAERAGLKISSKLLNVSDVVKGVGVGQKEK
jgi:hypothetical protein